MNTKLVLGLAAGVSLVLAAPAANAYAMMYCLEGQAYVVTCTGPNNDDCWTNAAGGCVGAWAIELEQSAIAPDTPTRGSPRDPIRQTASLLHDWRPDPKTWSRPSERFMAGLKQQGVQGRLVVPARRLAPLLPSTTEAAPGHGGTFGGATGGVPPRAAHADGQIRRAEPAPPPAASTPR